MAPRKLSRGATLALAVAGLIGTAPADAAVKLDFWDMIWGPPAYIDAAKHLVEKFNGEHPDIQVEYRSVPWSNWYQTYVTAVGAGSAPDISTGAGYQAVQLYDMGAIRPMDDVVAALKQSGDLDDFLPGTVDTLRYDGHYVALPWGLDIRVWYYRKDLLEAAGIAPPADWEQFRAAAKALTKDGHYGLLGSGDTGGSHYLYSTMLNNGGGLFDEQRNLTFDAQRNREALELLAGMQADGSVHPASAGYSSDDRRRAFYQGQAAFILDGPGLIGQAGEAADKIRVLPPMTGPHGDKGTIFWVNNIMMYEQTKHPEETKTFLAWWSKNQKPLWTEGKAGQIPARKSIGQDPYFRDNEARRYIIDNYIPIGKTTATKAPGIFPQLNELEGEGVMQTLIQDIWQGKPLSEAMPKAESRLEGIMKK